MDIDEVVPRIEAPGQGWVVLIVQLFFREHGPRMEFRQTPVIGFNGSGDVFANLELKIQTLSKWRKTQLERSEHDSDYLLVHAFVVHPEVDWRMIDDAVDREDLKHSRGIDDLARYWERHMRTMYEDEFARRFPDQKPPTPPLAVAPKRKSAPRKRSEP